jgi:RNA polymerase sigma factor (TIGR02999 family)
MRQILIDVSRRAKALKRNGARQCVDLNQVDLACHEQPVNLLGLDKLLSRLREFDPRLDEIVKLRTFGELSIGEIATLLQIAESTVRRRWAEAKEWLRAEIERPSRELAPDRRKDGSLNVYLNALPVNGELNIRDPRPRGEAEDK